MQIHVINHVNKIDTGHIYDRKNKKHLNIPLGIIQILIFFNINNETFQ